MRFRNLALCCAMSVFPICLSSQRSFAAVIQAVSSIPLDAGGVFDYSNPGSSYSLGAGSALESDVPGSYNLGDIFGQTLTTVPGEQGDVIFADGLPIGTVETVDVTLAEPVTLGSFVLYLEDNEGGAKPTNGRSVREFQLYAGNTPIDDIQILDDSGTQSYDGVYGGTNGEIEVQDSLVDAPLSASYALSFIQNSYASGGSLSGMRVNEFGAYAAPEPGCVSLVGFGLCAILLRRDRRVHG
jgi:hypothetical protein